MDSNNINRPDSSGTSDTQPGNIPSNSIPPQNPAPFGSPAGEPDRNTQQSEPAYRIVVDNSQNQSNTYANMNNVQNQDNTYGNISNVQNQDNTYGNRNNVQIPNHIYGNRSNVPNPNNTYGNRSNVPNPNNTYGNVNNAQNPANTYGYPNSAQNQNNAYSNPNGAQHQNHAYGSPNDAQHQHDAYGNPYGTQHPNNAYGNPNGTPYQNNSYGYPNGSPHQDNTHGNPYGSQNGTPYPNYQLVQKSPADGLITASLALGIATIVSAILGTVYFPFILGGIGIVLALLSKGYDEKMSSKPKIGIICALVGLVLNIFVVGTSVYKVFTDERTFNQFDRVYEQMYGESFRDMYKDATGQDFPFYFDD